MTMLRLDAIPVAAFRLAPTGLLDAANPAFRALLAAEDVVGAPVAALLADEPAVTERLRAAAASAQPLRLHLRRRTGVPFSADAFTAQIDDDGSLLCLLREVSDAQLLDESQRWLDVAFETAPIGMALFDTEGRYVRVNEALCRMLATSAEQLLGRRDQEFTHPDDRQRDVDAAWRILAGDASTWQTEKRFIAGDGELVWAIANLTFLRDDAGRPLCWLGQFQDITIRKAQEHQLRHLAEHDELTGVANRRRVLDELAERLEHVARYGERGAVILLDLDGFKRVNDTQGHDAGDRALVAVTGALTARLRSTDLLGRIGGDEFAVVLPHADAAAATTVATTLRRAVVDASGGQLGASCGIALFGPGHPRCAERLLAAADTAMYVAKTARGDGVALAGAVPSAG